MVIIKQFLKYLYKKACPPAGFFLSLGNEKKVTFYIKGNKN